MFKLYTKPGILVVGLILISSLLHLQVYGQTFNDPDFYSIQQKFNKKWENVDFRIKDNIRGKGWKTFKRWEFMMEPRVFPNGFFNSSGALWEETMKYNFAETQYSDKANWTNLGPFQVPTEASAPTELAGNGRIDCIEFHPSDSNIIWVGTPSGGAWKSVDHGNTWTPMTNKLPAMGIADIAINPSNPQIIYLATGDRDSYAGTQQFGGYSVGVLKSTDSGQNWSLTGLSYKAFNNMMISDLIINSENTQIVIAATSIGIFRSENGGDTWSQIVGGHNFKDIKSRPGDPNTLYAATMSDGGTSAIFRSTDGGLSFNEIRGLPLSAVGRYELAVTSANPNAVYALASDVSDDSFGGLMKSTDNGVSWQIITNNTPLNLFGWETAGNDDGGQGSYDISLAVSPTNENQIYVGGVNIWRTLDGGASWKAVTNWYTKTGYDYVHADQHYFDFSPLDGMLYAGNDGGIYRTENGLEWTDISHTLTALQIYRIGISQTSNLALTGNQDNGTYRLQADGKWTSILGGDGMECAVDPTNAATIYGELYYGALYRSDCGGCTFKSISPTNQQAAWVAPYVIHPTSTNTIFLGGRGKVHISDNKGDTWRASAAIGTEDIQSVAVSADNSSTIYAASFSRIWRTTNTGQSWTEITTGLPKRAITYIAVSHKNPNHIWVTLSGFQEGTKIFSSTDAGATWQNFSDGLPNVPFTSIIYQRNSNDALYATCDIGVFYREAGMPKWIPFSKGLPGGMIYEVDIQYNENKIFAGSWGRGLWVSPLYTKSDADLGVTAILNPTSGNDRTNTEQITVQIYNFGNQEQSNFDVAFEFNGNIYVEKFVNAIAAGDTAEFTFSQKIDMSVQGIYHVKCYTQLANDTDAANDHVTAQIWNHDTNPEAEAGNYVLNLPTFGESVNCGRNDALNLSGAFTIEAWINPSHWGEAPSGYGRIVDKDKYILYINKDYIDYGMHSLVFSYYNASDVNIRLSTPSYSIKLNEWQHVVVTGNGTNKPEIYINGVKQTLTTYGTAFAGMASSAASDLYIGESPNQNRAFVGKIDEVRIWKIYRTESEINANACADVSGNQDLVGHWRFNEGNGATYAFDMTGNGSNGVFTNIDPYKNWVVDEHYCCAPDVALAEIISPNSGQKLSNAENVTIKIVNNTPNAISNFDVNYQIDNKAWVFETLTTPINPGSSYEYTFQTKADFSATQGYELNTLLSYDSDKCLENNKLSKTIYSTFDCFAGNKASSSPVFFQSINISDYTTSTQYEGYYVHNELVNIHLNKKYTFTTYVEGYNSNIAGKIWLDWNNDGVLVETEKYHIKFNEFGVGKAEFMGDENTELNVIKMRIMVTDTTQMPTLTPCSQLTVGETEDFAIQLLNKLSDQSEILSFAVDGQTEATQIDTENKKITVFIPREASLKEIKASFVLSTNAKAYINNVYQVSGESVNNFTDTIVYKIMAQDETHFTLWKVRVRWPLNHETHFVSFTVPNVIQSLVDTTAATVNMLVPDETNLTSLVATFKLADGATTKVNDVQQISGSTANNFTSPVVYKVTSENQSRTRDWTVKVSKLTGINTLPDAQLEVYPNPVVSNLYIKSEKPVGVIIYTQDGKNTVIQTASKEEHEINVSHLATGIYVVKIVQGNLQNTRIIHVSH